MIIKIRRGQPEFKITLGRPGYPGDIICDYRRIRLVIRAPEPPLHIISSGPKRTGCWPYNPPDPDELMLHERPAIVYPAFELDDEGALVFRLDSHMDSLPSARYIGTVEHLEGFILTELDLDLENRPYLIEKVEITEVACR